MADRTIVARLRMEANQFLATAAKASKATRSIGDGADETSKKADSAFRRMAATAQKNSGDINRLGNTALIAGGSIAAGLGLGVKAFADFDAAMSQASAALPDAGAAMDEVRDLAVRLGKETQFTATEAAQGVTELAKAGVSVEEIMGGALPGALDLAASGQLEVADAAEIAASAMVQFKQDGEDVPHIADLLAAGAGKAQGSVYDLGQALAQAGLVAQGTGLTIEETTGGLAAFASAGLVGSDAGTSFKTMLQRLTPQSEEARKEMERLGISAYDQQGNFIGLSEFAGNLQQAMADLTPEARNTALAVIFGSDAVRAANVLYEQGAEGIGEWEDAVNDAGYASRQAAALTDNLQGDIRKLGSSIEAAFITNGAPANDALRSLTQGVRSMVDGFTELPPSVQQGAFGFAALTAAALLAAGAFAKVVTTGADLLDSLDAINTKAPRAAAALRAVGKAGIVVGVAAVASELAALSPSANAATVDVDELQRSLEGLSDTSLNAEAFQDLFREGGLFARDIESTSDALDQFAENAQIAFGENFTDKSERFVGFGTSVDKFTDQVSQLDAALASMVAGGKVDEAEVAYGRFIERIEQANAEGANIPVDQIEAQFSQYQATLDGTAESQTAAGDTAGEMADELSAIDQAAADAEEAVSDLAEAIRNFGGKALSADEAQDKFRQSIDDFSETLEDNKQAAKDNAKAVADGEMTKAEAAREARNANREQRDALREIATAALENSAATLELTGSTEKATEKVDRGREAFVKAATQMGYTQDEAETLADKYGLIPENVETTVAVNGAEAARVSVQALIDTIALLNDKYVTVGTRFTYTGERPNGGRSQAGGITIDADGGMHTWSGGALVKAYADGGMWQGSFRSARPQIRKAGGRGVLWAEEGAGPWEAFISGHPGKRARSRVIAEDTVKRLGGQIQWARPFADGGIFGSSSSHTETNDQRVFIDKVYGATVGDVVNEAEQVRSWKRSQEARG